VNKSTYSYDGATLRGPAPGPLTAYPATLEGQRLVDQTRLISGPCRPQGF
jgi:Rieske Fe-S protein